MTTNVRYAVVFDSIETALDAHVNVHGTEVMELRPDGTCRPLNWDGEAPPQPTPEFSPTGGFLNDALLRGLAASLAKCYSYPVCGIQMPVPAPKPDSAQS
jgi:hypothetical protein